MKRGKKMKKLSKTLLAVAAVSAVSMAMAASAMAMTAEYDPESGNVTLSDVNATGVSQTLLVVKGENISVTTDNANDVVEQIDQKDDSNVFATVPVGELTDGTYEVRIGGTNGTIQTATFKVGEQPGGETFTIMIGDANGNGSLLINDAAAIATKIASNETAQNANVGKVYKYVSGLETAPESGTIMVGDANGNGSLLINDAAAIATKIASNETAQNANVGVEVEVSEIAE